MEHEDRTRKADLSRAVSNRPDPLPSGVGNGGDLGPPSPPIDPLVIATTDPVIEVVADYQPEWRRHPEATISLATTQVGDPALLADSVPRTIAFGRPRPASGPSDQGDEPSREATPGDEPRSTDAPAGPQPSRAHGGVPARHAGRIPIQGEGHPRRPAARGDRAITRPRSSGAWFPWVVAGAALLGGVIGSAGYLYLFRSRSWA